MDLSLKESDMTYEDYLVAWERMYGEDEEAETSYSVRAWDGKRHSITNMLHRLSREEFNVHWKAMLAANEKWCAAEKIDDEAGMKQALRESFPHEVELLV